MQLINLTVDRIIIHQVFRRDADGNKIPPTQSHEYTKFDQNAMEEFKTRINDALGDGSKSVEMEIVNQAASDLPRLIDKMVEQDDVTFAVSSYDIARKLTNAQQMRSIPGGILVIFDGHYGVPEKKLFGIIKAEIHSGYEKEQNSQTQEITLKFVEEILLTPGTRLYKTAAFLERSDANNDGDDLNNKWLPIVSDYQISRADGKAAAKYFYSDFLGCGYPQTSARITKQFYDNTSAFILNLGIPAVEKSDLMNALTIYLKVDTSSSASTSEFADKYFSDIDLQDSYVDHMRQAGIADNAFTKDIEYIKSKLKVRKLKFRKNIKITAPAEVFDNLISLELIESDSESGSSEKWTKVIIKDVITEQE